MFIKYWKILIPLILLSLSMFINWYLYNDTQTLATELSASNVARDICNSGRESLKLEIDILTSDIAKLEEKTKALEAKVATSKGVIHNINNDREMLLQRIAAMNVPESCDEIFTWMVERFEELK